MKQAIQITCMQEEEKFCLQALCHANSSSPFTAPRVQTGPSETRNMTIEIFESLDCCGHRFRLLFKHQKLRVQLMSRLRPAAHF